MSDYDWRKRLDALPPQRAQAIRLPELAVDRDGAPGDCPRCGQPGRRVATLERYTTDGGASWLRERYVCDGCGRRWREGYLHQVAATVVEPETEGAA